ncbi:hypothetical protein [Paenirhodobacter huangdaonensis]|nr:hypothetical protein [Sinirhodobacter huangdaonensis]
MNHVPRSAPRPEFFSALLGISYGFDTALLNMALDQYRKDGDSAAFRVATTNAAMQFARENGLQPDPELFFSATLLVLGFVPVVGTAIDGYQLYYDVQAGDWVAAGVDSVSLVASMIPIAGGGLRLLLRGSSRFIEVSGDGARVIRATNTQERITVRINPAGKAVVSIQGREMSIHASQQATTRGISNESIANAMDQQPFSYVPKGEALQGYYDASSNTFVGVGDRITTVVQPRNPTN